MNDYLLFIDTETTGLPKSWNRPYEAVDNWPHAIQISWLIYSKEGVKIKEENYYINNNNCTISPTAFKVHGLTASFLTANGISQKDVLEKLSKDLDQFDPMVIGYFMELDYHVIAAGYYRETIPNKLAYFSTFCIMIASQHLQLNPVLKFLRLGDLYQLLFKKTLLNQHNAMADAAATAECFFKLQKDNQIRSFIQSPISIQKPSAVTSTFGWVLAVLLLFFSAFLIACYYGKPH